MLSGLGVFGSAACRRGVEIGILELEKFRELEVLPVGLGARLPVYPKERGGVLTLVDTFHRGLSIDEIEVEDGIRRMDIVGEERVRVGLRFRDSGESSNTSTSPSSRPYWDIATLTPASSCASDRCNPVQRDSISPYRRKASPFLVALSVMDRFITLSILLTLGM